MSHYQPPKVVYKGANPIPLCISIAVGLIIWFIPVSPNIEPRAWHLFAIFIALIVGLLGKALPMGAMSFLAMTVLIITKVLTVKAALSGFGNPIIWLVVSAFLLSRSFIKTGFGTRIAYVFMGLFGKKTLGLGYGFGMTELLLAPALPSNTARAGAVVFPIARALAVSFDSIPERHSQRLIGSYLILTCYYCNLITSAMFITATATNPVIVGILQSMGYSISWSQWALATCVPGILSLIAVPYIVYKLYPPEIKDTPEAKAIAAQHLEAMGKMSKYEWITLGVFVFLIFLWIFGEGLFGIESATVALLGVSCLVVTGVLTWDDIKREHEAWDTLISFAILMMIASHLNEFGLFQYVSTHIQHFFEGFNWITAWLALTVIYFYSHYFFASNTVHVTSMYAAFVTVGLALNVPAYLLIMSLAVTSSLFACLTHYGTPCAPILFGSEYVNLKSWWRMGAIVSLVFIVIWIGLGSAWWKLLGLW